jgi:hypothetical protein
MMRLTIRISVENKQNIQRVVDDDGDMHCGLQSRCIEWGLKQAFSMIKEKGCEFLYQKDREKSNGNCNICISVADSTATEFNRLCRAHKRDYKSIGHRIAQWATEAALKEWKETGTVSSFYR